MRMFPWRILYPWEWGDEVVVMGDGVMERSYETQTQVGRVDRRVDRRVGLISQKGENCYVPIGKYKIQIDEGGSSGFSVAAQSLCVTKGQSSTGSSNRSVGKEHRSWQRTKRSVMAQLLSLVVVGGWL
jgi:hypothetical protein